MFASFHKHMLIMEITASNQLTQLKLNPMVTQLTKLQLIKIRTLSQLLQLQLLPIKLLNYKSKFKVKLKLKQRLRPKLKSKQRQSSETTQQNSKKLLKKLNHMLKNTPIPMISQTQSFQNHMISQTSRDLTSQAQSVTKALADLATLSHSHKLLNLDLSSSTARMFQNFPLNTL